MPEFRSSFRLSRRALLATLAVSGLPGCGASGSSGDSSSNEATGTATGSITDFASGEPAATQASYAGTSFTHPGMLHTGGDFTRMASNLTVSPWSDGYAQLQSAVSGMSGWTVNATSTVSRYSSAAAGTSNFSNFATDIGRAYACALYWKVSGSEDHAVKAMAYMNTWSATLTSIAGDNDIALLALNAYQFANVVEIMRTYAGCTPANLVAFQAMMKIFSDQAAGTDGASGWLYSSLVSPTVYSNWQLSSIAALMAIGVLMDDVGMFNAAVEYFRTGQGNGGIKQAVYYLHPGYLGQTQEAGRDQGHATLAVGLMGVICEMAWNQGIDLYGFDNNRVLAGCEYIAMGNLAVSGAYPTMPFTEYKIWGVDHTAFATGSQGLQRNEWAVVYNHYVNRKGLAAPHCKAFFASRVETASDNDMPGFGTLTYARADYTGATTPTGLAHYVNDGSAVLSWWGTHDATSYVVKRSTSPTAGYAEIATIDSGSLLTYTDSGIAAGTYYYVVTAISASGESGASNRVEAVTATQLHMQLALTESSGDTASDSSGNGLDGALVSAGWSSSGRNGGNALSLTGDGSYVELPDDLTTELGDCTVALWTYWQGAANSREYLFSLGNGSDQFLVFCPQWSDGFARVMVSASTRDGDKEIVTGARLTPNAWIHVVLTLSSGALTLYYDGVQAGQVASTWQPHHFGRTDKNWLGRWADNCYTGLISDFRIYHNAMSASEVSSLYASA
jgi:hypothetical protein